MQQVDNRIQVIAPTLPKLEYNVRKLLEGLDFPAYVSANPDWKWASFKACDIALAVSGTVGLELAYAGVPHLIAYKVNPLTEVILRSMVKVKHVHLANILLEKSVVPECLQAKCNPGFIAQTALDLLNSDEAQAEQKQAFEKIGELLGEKYEESPPQRAANFISSVIKG